MIARALPCPPLPPLNLHGKEGDDGSSPSEGFRKKPCKWAFVLSVQTPRRRLAGTRRVHFRTSGHSQARAALRDQRRGSPIQPPAIGNACKQRISVVDAVAKATTSFAREEVKDSPSDSRSSSRVANEENGPAPMGWSVLWSSAGAQW